MLFLLNMESVFVIGSTLYYFYEGVFTILGNNDDVFLALAVGGTGGTLLILLTGFYIAFISALALPNDFPLLP